MTDREKQIEALQNLYIGKSITTQLQADKLKQEYLEADVTPCTVYQYFYGDNFIGDSSDYTVRDLLHNMGVEIEK